MAATSTFTAKTGMKNTTEVPMVTAISTQAMTLARTGMVPFSRQVRMYGPSRRWFMSQL